MSFFSNTSAPSAEEVNIFHTSSDVDKSAISQHHTLGTLSTQASPGDHNHDGISSKRLNFSDIDGGLWNIDGGIPSTIYTPIPAWDGGGI
jgi:hypothetical protein